MKVHNYKKLKGLGGMMCLLLNYLHTVILMLYQSAKPFLVYIESTIAINSLTLTAKLILCDLYSRGNVVRRRMRRAYRLDSRNDGTMSALAGCLINPPSLI